MESGALFLSLNTRTAQFGSNLFLCVRLYNDSRSKNESILDYDLEDSDDVVEVKLSEKFSKIIYPLNSISSRRAGSCLQKVGFTRGICSAFLSRGGRVTSILKFVSIKINLSTNRVLSEPSFAAMPVESP